MTRKLAMVLPLSIFCQISAASGGSPFVLSDGINRAPAITLHCAGLGATAVPCGVPSQPLVVMPVIGGATSQNQSAAIAVQQSMAQTLGAQTDGAYSTGAGSVVSLLKGVILALSGAGNAGPIGGQPVARSMTVSAQQSVTLLSSNAGRHYLAFQAPAGSALWVNFVGGVAAPNAADCVYLPAGTLYESGSFVDRGAISIYSPVATMIAAWEG